MVLRIEPRGLHMLSKHPATELCPHPVMLFFQQTLTKCLHVNGSRMWRKLRKDKIGDVKG